MSDSFFGARKESVFAAGSANFATKTTATPIAYGLTAPQAAAYAALNTAYQAAYLAAITPATRTKGTVAAKNAARIPLRQMASNLAKVIAGTPTVSEQQRIDLGLSVPKLPSPVPAPGTPNRFKAELTENGAVTLTWKCQNPKGSSGTVYQVWRRVGGAGEFEYLGGAGGKTFTDETIPAGSAQVTYQIQAVRSTAVGAFAQFNVNFGVAGQTAAVEETAPVRLAA